LASSAPKTIVYVISCLRIGGGERQLCEFLRHIDRTRWRPIITCFEKVGELLPQLAELGVDPIEFPLRGDLEQPNTAYQALRLAKLIVLERAAVVHGYDFWGNVLAVAAGRLALRPVIVSQLDQGLHLTPLQKRGQAFMRQLASRVVVNARELAREIVAQGTRPDKVWVLPQGLDLARFDKLSKSDPKLPPFRGPTVAMVANMSGPQKGHEEVLEAARALTGVRFVLCGDGGYRPTLERRAVQLGLSQRVLFLGKRLDVPAILSRASCAVHPSHSEGLPTAVLEAQAARKAVVATRVGGTPEIVVDRASGYLVPPRSPEALTQALRELLRDPSKAQKMGERGRAHIEQHFTLREMAERHDRLYSELSHS
jgi:glycosyltransferase involved in cell wall biosynthesis